MKFISMLSNDKEVREYFQSLFQKPEIGNQYEGVIFGTDEDFFENVEEIKPSFILLATDEIKTISEEDHIASQCNRLKKIKNLSKHSIIIIYDIKKGSVSFMESGADYFLAKPLKTENFLYLFLKIVKNKKFTQSERLLLLEKKDFYDFVAKNHLFEKRAKITANLRAEFKFLKKIIKQNNCKKIFDAGCGDGRLSIKLAEEGFDVIGGDLTKRLIEEARNKSNNFRNPHFLQLNFLKTPFNNQSFDAVCMMWHVICEVKERHEELIKEMYRILKIRGILIFDFPDKAKHQDIDKEGWYVNEISGFKKYIGLVPDIQHIINLLNYLGFSDIYYRRVKWGVNKFVVVARKQ